MNEFIHNNRLYYNPIEFAMAHIGGTWKIPILRCLRNGAMRYGDLKLAIPRISHKMLITQLRELEDKKMLTRHTFNEKPPRVEYRLTALAQQALPVIDQLAEYGIALMKEAGIDS
ncbi:transcriptional regulator [Parapedobacter pyrenivorans]|uniref:Transcriptional regulator n=1 Tax=Parapedobacter pyrenivorans TaxID=1305674 RepID=A0A917I0L8_9SPHI|nr:helix-turn-helix domain-containing protein [Parapedobacter pyrenivorans]GGG99745.1 transcriptional regulator [Parapedobacter pyrenivorans]